MRSLPYLRPALAVAGLLILVAIGLGLRTGATQSSVVGSAKTQESIFQDDDHLLYSPATTVEETLGVLQGLGIDRVRVTVKWSILALAPLSRTRPAFDATDPAAYPAPGWIPYDRLVRLALAHRIRVDFDVTAPGPLWAMRHGGSARAADHYAPSELEFGRFVTALGRRYSGSYVPAVAPGAGQLPRVGYWSIWNEPNQPGWLAPQWHTVGAQMVADSPRLYRAYVDRAVAALDATGHSTSTDTILIGELAPSGLHQPSAYKPMTPMPFLRALYCVDGSYRPLTGSRAAALGCPSAGDPKAFVTRNPGLFGATGFAHHPYDLYDSPAFRPRDRSMVTLSTLPRMYTGLDRIFASYGVPRRLPFYLTEYGYQTNPPDPYQIVTPVQQAAYLDQADYMSWRDPRVRALTQFLLSDAKPDTHYPVSSPKYWDTFQTGLLYANGTAKPAFATFGLPIWLPTPHTDRAGKLLVWGHLRAAPHGTAQTVSIQWRGGGAFRTIATTSVRSAAGYFTVMAQPPGSGSVRIVWRTGSGLMLASRAVTVTV